MLDTFFILPSNKGYQILLHFYPCLYGFLNLRGFKMKKKMIICSYDVYFDQEN